MPPSYQPLNIVHVVRQFRPGIGGLENFVEQLAEQQIAAGHHATVATLDRIFDSPDGLTLPEEDEYQGVRIRRSHFWGSRRYPIAPHVLQHVRNADVVHVHAVDFFCDFLAATKFLHGKTLILTTHGGYFHTEYARRLKDLYFRIFTRMSLTRYAAVVTCSDNDTQKFRSIRKGGLIGIANAVDVNKFASMADRNSKKVIYFGRLAPNKQILRLIDWFDGLRQRDKAWSLTIAGKPMGVSLGKLGSEIRKRNLDEAIHLVDTPSDTELAKLISDSSVYACASSYEGFGLAAVEAASAGLYPILSKIAPFEETIKRIGFGQTVDYANPESYSASYTKLEENFAQFCRVITDSEVKVAVESYGWNRAARKYEQVYLAAMGRTERKIGQVRLDVLSETEALNDVCQAVECGGPRLFTFANAHTINMAAQHPMLARALSKATVLNDGIGANIASKLLYGAAFPENLNGTDLTPKILSTLGSGTTVFILGSTDKVASEAARVLATRHPHLMIVGYHSGFFDHENDNSVARQIKLAKAQVVLVGMGQPRQEIWAEQNVETLGATIVCVGAFLDFTAGAVKRAPLWWRQLHLEWLFRLLQEPRRLASRYLIGNVIFLTQVLKQYTVGHRL